MKFSKEYMQEEAFDNCVEDKIIGKSRWSVNHEMAFKHEGKFYRTSYSCGATEYQEEAPFEYADDEVECEEVHKVPKTVMVWEKV
jgi:hypothetical protein